MTVLAFVDTETTGLEPTRHEVWEVGLILDNGEDLREFEWMLPVRLELADSRALDVNGYYDRFEKGKVHVGAQREFADSFARLTHGAHLVGAVPSFDDAFLKRLLRRNGACPGWHYHLVDVEALAAGWLAGRWCDPEWPAPTDDIAFCQPPWNSNELSLAVGVDPKEFERHTALGDARWARAIYQAVMAGGGT